MSSAAIGALRALAVLFIASPLVGMLSPQSHAQAAATASAPAGSVGGLGDINLYPKRLVLTDRDRLGTIGLYNRSPATGEYEISITDKLMLPDGSIVDVDDEFAGSAPPGFRPASTMLRFSPKSVQLPGNESQTVRIVPRLPVGLPPGEYRSHFTVVAVPPLETGDSISAAVNGPAANGIGVQVLPRFGISIPVIVRVGTTTLTAGIKDARLEKSSEGAWEFAALLTREGTRSAFGDVIATAPGFAKPIAQLRGVGLYTEIGSRPVRIPLDPSVARGKLPSGLVVTLTYIDDDAAPGTVLARQDIRVP